MRKINRLALITIFSVLMTGCNNEKITSETDSMDTVSNTAIIENIIEVDETVATFVEERETDKIVCNWLYNSLTDSEEFTDINDYRYYARALGLDKDYFLNPQMWEVYYNPEININNEINGQEIYLLRINPYQLLNIYAERNNCTVDEICASISATKEQLYYNWGYNPAWVNYDKNHADLKVFASEKEISIFGSSNTEDRVAVMRTHTLTVDTTDNNVCYYSSTVGNRLKIRRMDLLGAVSDDIKYYSGYTEQERNASFTVNGIGIRAVIPLLITNAWEDIVETDKEVTPFINVSPFAYGCSDEHKIEIKEYMPVEED